MEEFWKDIPGYEGLYQVSTKGRVRSLDRVRDHGAWDRKRFLRGRVLKLQKNTNGYIFIALSKNGKVVKDRVHKLVQAAFPCIFPLELGAWIDHEDRDRANNNIENLRCCDNSRNLMNAKKRSDGLTSFFKGVWKPKDKTSWYAAIHINSKKKHLGCFKTELQAAAAYNKAALKYFGEYANLNVIGV